MTGEEAVDFHCLINGLGHYAAACALGCNAPGDDSRCGWLAVQNPVSDKAIQAAAAVLLPGDPAKQSCEALPIAPAY
jgi:hypothetical protein